MTPIYGSKITLVAVNEPEQLSISRRLFIGQPEAASSERAFSVVTREVALQQDNLSQSRSGG